VLRLLIVALLLAACGKSEPKRELDLDRIEVLGANLRTDTVGGGQFTDTATFILVDARNLANEGAYVTLGGELLDASGTKVSDLAIQSLWIPAGETRTFALVDTERKPRPTAKTARAKVRGASVFPPPLARIEDLVVHDDHGQLVVAANLVNDAPGDGTVMVIAVFHDAGNRPLTRPFNMVKIAGKKEPVTPGNCPDAGEDRIAIVSKCPIQFVGPPGAKRATIFIGDTLF
jgi:predicted secreted protein